MNAISYYITALQVTNFFLKKIDHMNQSLIVVWCLMVTMGFGMIWVIDEHYSVQTILCGVSIERIFSINEKAISFGASVLNMNSILFSS